MSQIQVFLGATSPALPDIETISGNTGGAAGPDGAGNFNVIADPSTGMQFVSNAGTNSDTLQFLTSQVETVDAATEDALTFTPPSTPGIYKLTYEISAWNDTDEIGSTYEIKGAMTINSLGTISDTGIATREMVGESPPFDISQVSVTVVGANIILRVTGILGDTINWTSKLTYFFGGA